MKCKNKKHKIKYHTQPKQYLEVSNDNIVFLLKSMDWRLSLKYYTKVLNLGIKCPLMKIDPKLTVEKIVNEKLQQHCPGSYIVKKRYNTTLSKWELIINFDNPKDETVWMLKYG